MDLIAGLPYEDLESFKQSFQDVYEVHPEQLQLGFLKVLKGSYKETKTILLFDYQNRDPLTNQATVYPIAMNLIKNQ